jgi:hypothetical protein
MHSQIRCASLLAAFAAGVATFPTTAQQAPNGSRTSPDHGIEVFISEDALQALYTRRVNIGELGTADIHAGVFFNEDRDLVGIGDVLTDVADASRFPRWSFQVGPRTYAILLGTENQDIFGVGLGGRARYTVGHKQSLSIQLAGFYAPDILTFGQADNVSEVSTRVDLAFNPNLSGFIGYRIFNVGLLGGDKRIDDGVQVGFRRNF